MKQTVGYGISINHNSNIIYTSSQTDWSKVRQGAFIRIGNNNSFNTISECNPYFLIKEFQVESPKSIVISYNEEEYMNDILEKDVVTISYKEFELDSIYGFISKGQNYRKNSLLYLTGGTQSSSFGSNAQTDIILNVLEVGPNGELEKIGIKSKGKYLIPPSNHCAIRSEFGSGAILDCDFKELSHRSKLEREVLFVKYEAGKVTLILNYALPIGLQEGKISIDKYAVSLKEIYTGPQVINGEYFLSFDFTHNFNFPIMPPNCPRPDIVYNNFVLTLDSVLKQLTSKD